MSSLAGSSDHARPRLTLGSGQRGNFGNAWQLVELPSSQFYARSMGDTAAPAVTSADHKWQIRYTWEPLDGVPHARFTYSQAESEDRAIDIAVVEIDRMEGNPSLRLVEVHRRHVGSKLWCKVE